MPEIETMSRPEIEVAIKVFYQRLDELQARHLLERNFAYEASLARRIQNLQDEIEAMEHEHGC